MSGNTTKGLPYATGSDTVASGDLAIKALADALELLIPVKVRKTALETVNNTAVLQNDDHLFFNVVAGKTYSFEFNLLFACASSAAGAKLALTFPAGTMAWSVIGRAPDGAAGSAGIGAFSALYNPASGTALSVGVPAPAGGVTHATARIKGTFVCTTTGQVRLQWAQNVATASNTDLAIGSELIWS